MAYADAAGMRYARLEFMTEFENQSDADGKPVGQSDGAPGRAEAWEMTAFFAAIESALTRVRAIRAAISAHELKDRQAA